jgi:hypothetical protein
MTTINPVWPFIKQPAKDGYNNNPRFAYPATTTHQPCGYWRNSEITGYTEAWIVNNIVYSGLVVTVGVGKDYTTVVDAVSATTEDLLVLIYAGNYVNTSPLTDTTRNVYFKNMEATVDLVTMYASTSSTVLSTIRSSSLVIYDGVTFNESTTYSHMTNLHTVVDGSYPNVIFNKCVMNFPTQIPSNPSYALFNSTGLNGVSAKVVLQNCTVNIGAAAFYAGIFNVTGDWDLSVNEIKKCLVTNDVHYSYQVYNVPFITDYVAVATTDYGSSYGEEIIKFGWYNPVYDNGNNAIWPMPK